MIDTAGNVHDTSGRFSGHVQVEAAGDLGFPAPLTGQDARAALAVLDIELPDSVTAEVFDAPQKPGWIDPELYESTVAIFTGSGGTIEVYREGDACVYLTNENRHLNSVEEFRDEFPDGNIPHEGENAAYYWRDNAWFTTTINGDLLTDEAEWDLRVALADAIRAAQGSGS